MSGEAHWVWIAKTLRVCRTVATRSKRQTLGGDRRDGVKWRQGCENDGVFCWLGFSYRAQLNPAEQNRRSTETKQATTQTNKLISSAAFLVHSCNVASKHSTALQPCNCKHASHARPHNDHPVLHPGGCASQIRHAHAQQLATARRQQADDSNRHTSGVKSDPQQPCPHSASTSSSWWWGQQQQQQPKPGHSLETRQP